jgi:single-strand DNA-binding protein
VNVVKLIGSTVTNAELRALDDEQTVATFLLALARPGGRSDVVRVEVRNAQAEACVRLLARGSRVAIDGRLRSRTREGAGGKRWHVVEVVAASVLFLSPAADVAPRSPEGEATMAL